MAHCGEQRGAPGAEGRAELTAALCCSSLSPLHVSGLMSAEAAAVCEKTDVTHAFFAFLQRVWQFGVFLRATASGKRKEGEKVVEEIRIYSAF